MNKIKLSLIIPVLCYIVFLFTLYSNINIASVAFFLMVLSTITITIIAFNHGEKDVKENQGA